jgi:hypothetical protein
LTTPSQTSFPVFLTTSRWHIPENMRQIPGNAPQIPGNARRNSGNTGHISENTGVFLRICGNRPGFGRKLAKRQRALAAYRARGVRDLHGFALGMAQSLKNR